MLRDEIIEAIKESGFDEYREISSSDLIFDESVFASCAENKCGNYGSNYSCPPLSGDLKENQARFLKYDHGIRPTSPADSRKREDIPWKEAAWI